MGGERNLNTETENDVDLGRQSPVHKGPGSVLGMPDYKGQGVL